MARYSARRGRALAVKLENYMGTSLENNIIHRALKDATVEDLRRAPRREVVQEILARLGDARAKRAPHKSPVERHHYFQILRESLRRELLEEERESALKFLQGERECWKEVAFIARVLVEDRMHEPEQYLLPILEWEWDLIEPGHLSTYQYCFSGLKAALATGLLESRVRAARLVQTRPEELASCFCSLACYQTIFDVMPEEEMADAFVACAIEDWKVSERKAINIQENLADGIAPREEDRWSSPLLAWWATTQRPLSTVLLAKILKNEQLPRVYRLGLIQLMGQRAARLLGEGAIVREL